MDKERPQLQCIANAGGGKYYDAKNAAELKVAASAVERSIAAAPTPAATATPSEFNLLSPDNGGHLVAAPSEDWQKLITGNDFEGHYIPSEGVFAFKDGKPATFSKFEIPITATSTCNVQDFELLAADDSPTGSFRSLGKFTNLAYANPVSPASTTSVV